MVKRVGGLAQMCGLTDGTAILIGVDTASCLLK